MLEDAVAIGYGSVKKEDLTGSVSAIKAEGINRGVVTSADDLLKGKMTGVQIIPGGGGPGSSGTIRIRGAASLNASNDPLIVIDGVPHGEEVSADIMISSTIGSDFSSLESPAKTISVFTEDIPTE